MIKSSDKLILDCQNFETTLSSVSKITGLDSDLIIDILSSLPTDEYYTIDDIWDKLIVNCNNRDFTYDRICWFHGTRTKNHLSFVERGILPLNTIMSELTDFLEVLNKKIDINHFEPIKEIDTRRQLGIKLAIQKGGPYGFLIRDIFFEKNSRNYDFLELPEILFDIIYSNNDFKKNSNKLIELYKAATKSCIVKFYDVEIDEYYLKTACLYLFLKTNKLGLTVDSNTCFVGKGEIISSNRIIDIEILN